MLTLTPLETVSAFSEQIRAVLAEYWITSAEEFATTAHASNQQFGTAQAALAQVLGITQDEVTVLVNAARAVLPLETTFGVGVQPEVGTGAIFENMHFPRATAFDVPSHLPSEINLTEGMPLPQQQGKRDTCLAFALVALYQHATGDFSDLSEQFLYWACKERDGLPYVRGTRPDVAFEVLRDMGICTELTWPYQSHVIVNDEGQGPPPDGAVEEAWQRRILAYSCLPDRDPSQIKASLAGNRAVLIGLPIYEHWTTTWQAHTLGRVRKPLPGESQSGGHAMTVLGYRDDQTAPGGGYFIVRNSWGTGWGTQNLDGPGYCHIPYRLMEEQNSVTCVIEEWLPPPALPASTESAVTGEEAALSVDAELQELYNEARAIRNRLNTLIERLAVLVGRTRSDS